jgi:hypothetical protein
MADDQVMDLIEEAIDNSALRRKLAQDRTAAELAESANREGYSISEREARKILAGAYLTDDRRTEEERRDILGGIAWNFLEEVEDRLDRDFGLLESRDAWERSKSFHENVFQS